ncbi:hypothetical protein SAMN02745248_02403 [Hathewaya proteolytica DSM 3090]|uniref:Uncharacterized protein n=1 Tax=Hathewaya proteolytica DSM 3090 TaxID=1121331 RepID=A0A1M6RZJ0_9CLOT|nr:hypothetical protein [Hathewaya proteolytica]SHK37895.1 hypothetical protein SAMN02745248_02403 [Hathewaya proteolytica DSM 3090]
MYIELKYLFKKAIIADNEIMIGKLNIDVDNITEIKYQAPTATKQGFITFCTFTSGRDVKDLNTATLDKNSIIIYKKDNDKLEEILNYFNNRNITIIDVKEDDDKIHCPKCGSTQITANKKGFSLGKGILGAAITPGLGLVTGAMGKNKIEVTCLKCGHKWKAGKK